MRFLFILFHLIFPTLLRFLKFTTISSYFIWQSLAGITNKGRGPVTINQIELAVLERQILVYSSCCILSYSRLPVEGYWRGTAMYFFNWIRVNC